jgi:hypothetical protein
MLITLSACVNPLNRSPFGSLYPDAASLSLRIPEFLLSAISFYAGPYIAE